VVPGVWLQFGGGVDFGVPSFRGEQLSSCQSNSLLFVDVLFY